jgi:hypothetical protein
MRAYASGSGSPGGSGTSKTLSVMETSVVAAHADQVDDALFAEGVDGALVVGRATRLVSRYSVTKS